MDTRSENMVLDKRDIDFILSAYLRSYLFYNKNTPPKEIHVPMVPEVRNFRDKAGSMIPVKFVEFKEEAKEEQSATIRPRRTSRDRESTKTIAPSNEDASQHH